MKYKSIEADPFDEENWNEVDSFLTIFKVRIGAQTKTISLTFFPAKIEITEDEDMIIFDNKNNKLLLLDSNLNEKVKKGIPMENMFLIHNDYVNEERIKRFLYLYLNNRKKKCEMEISNIKNDIEEENGEYYELHQLLDNKNILLYNIENFNINSEVKKMLKIFFNK